MIRFTCLKCGHRIKTSDASAGRKGKCPKCGHPVMVPAAEEGLVRDDLPADPGAKRRPTVAAGKVDANQVLEGDPRIKECPHCGGAILSDVATCVHCRRSLDKSHAADRVTTGATPNLDAARTPEEADNKRSAWVIAFPIAAVLAAAVLLAGLLFWVTSRPRLTPRGYFYANKLGVSPFDRVVPEHVVFCVVVVDVPCRQFAVDSGYEFDPHRFKCVLPDGTGNAGAVVTLWKTEKDKYPWQTWAPFLGLYHTEDVNESDAHISTGESVDGSEFQHFVKDLIHPVVSLAIGFVLPDGEHKPPLAIQLDSGSQVPIPPQGIQVSESIAAYDPALRRPSGHARYGALEPRYAVQLYKDNSCGFFTCLYPCGWTVREVEVEDTMAWHRNMHGVPVEWPSHHVHSRRVEFLGAEAEIGVNISMAQDNDVPDSKVVETLISWSRRLFPAEGGHGIITPLKISDDSSYSFIYTQDPLSRIYGQEQPPFYVGVTMFYSDRRLHVLTFKTANEYLFEEWSPQFDWFLGSYTPWASDRKN